MREKLKMSLSNINALVPTRTLGVTLPRPTLVEMSIKQRHSDTILAEVAVKNEKATFYPLWMICLEKKRRKKNSKIH